MFSYVRLIFGIAWVSSCAAPMLLANEPPVKSAAARPVYATPAEAVAAAQAAFARDDFEAEVDCFSPDGQKALSKTFLRLLVSMPPAALNSSPMGKEIAAIEAKYGLKDWQRKPGETDEQMIDRLAGGITTKREFVLATMGLNKGHNDKAQVPTMLEDVHIEDGGESAIGKLVRHEANGATVSQDVRFKKIGGSFLIDNAIFF